MVHECHDFSQWCGGRYFSIPNASRLTPALLEQWVGLPRRSLAQRRVIPFEEKFRHFFCNAAPFFPLEGMDKHADAIHRGQNQN
jgi:hypothetical protein